MSAVQITWYRPGAPGLDRRVWDAHHAQALGCLQQSWAYGQALQSLGVPVLRAVAHRPEGHADPTAPLACAQFLEQRIPWPIGLAYCLGGPLWSPSLGADGPGQRAVLQALRRSIPIRRPRLALLSPAVPQGEGEAQATALQPYRGRWRVMTGHASVLWSLESSDAERRAALESKWRNRLATAERHGWKVRECGAHAVDYQWLIDAEGSQRVQRRYLALPAGFIPAFVAAHRKPSQAILTLAAEANGQRCAGMLFLLHGHTATYHLGWTNDTGRDHSAHNLLLWDAGKRLAERGIRWVDLGGVDTQENPGLARFKLGTGGRPVQWAGTFA